MKTRTLTVLVLAVLLALIAGTAVAGTIRTPFTGMSTLIKWLDSDGRYWEPGRNSHYRDILPVARLETTDPRISGIACWVFNGNYRPSPDDPYFGAQAEMHGAIRIEQDGDLDCWNATDYWEGNFVGIRHPDGLETFTINLKGYGKYSGLQARYDEWSLGPRGDIEVRPVEGEIIDPGGK